MISTFVLALSYSAGIVFLVFLAWTFLRKQRLAAAIVVIVLALRGSGFEITLGPPWIEWPVNLIFFGILVLTLERFGSFALAVTILVLNVVGTLPIPSDISVWYAGEVICALIATLMIAVYGFRTALAVQPTFKTQSLLR